MFFFNFCCDKKISGIFHTFFDGFPNRLGQSAAKQSCRVFIILGQPVAVHILGCQHGGELFVFANFCKTRSKLLGIYLRGQPKIRMTVLLLINMHSTEDTSIMNITIFTTK